MPRSQVELEHSVEYLSILDEDGKVDDALVPDMDNAILERMFRTMLLARRFDEHLLTLQREGRIGTFAPVTGQEACQIGAMPALEDRDWFVPAFREFAARHWREFPLSQILLFAAGGMLLAHEAMHEGKTSARAAAGENAAFDARAIPAVVFTDPQIAWCRLTEADIGDTPRNVKILPFPWQASGRASSMGAAGGVTKLLVDADTARVLGVGIVGPQAEPMIADVLAIEMGATAEDMAASIHPHPTLSETLGEGAELFAGQATHYG